MVKQQRASRQLPCIGETAYPIPSLPLATMDVLRLGLAELLESLGGSLPLSNVKRLFRVRFGLDLSEIALGHSKLCELLQGDVMSDVCDVCLDGFGYTVFQRT